MDLFWNFIPVDCNQIKNSIILFSDLKYCTYYVEYKTWPNFLFFHFYLISSYTSFALSRTKFLTFVRSLSCFLVCKCNRLTNMLWDGFREHIFVWITWMLLILLTTIWFCTFILASNLLVKLGNKSVLSCFSSLLFLLLCLFLDF